MEEQQAYERKSSKKVDEGMEPIFEKIREKDFGNWQDIQKYLKKDYH